MEPFTERTPRVVAASKLHRTAARRKAGRFLAEGSNSVEAALAAGIVHECFMTSTARERYQQLLAKCTEQGVAVSTVTDKAMAHLSDTVTPPGLVAVCTSIVRSAADIAHAARPRLVAIGDGIGEPGNVGTLIRVADALGADEVWLTVNSADPESPKAVRASAGSLFYIPVVTGIAAGDVIKLAEGRGVNVLVATGEGTVDISTAAGAELLAKPTAWVFGNEAHGVSAQLRAATVAQVRIPIRGRAESLNIATAAAICLYESAKALLG